MTPFSTKMITIAVSWGLLGLLVVYVPQSAEAQIIETFPYLETFDRFDIFLAVVVCFVGIFLTKKMGVLFFVYCCKQHLCLLIANIL